MKVKDDHYHDNKMFFTLPFSQHSKVNKEKKNKACSLKFSASLHLLYIKG